MIAFKAITKSAKEATKAQKEFGSSSVSASAAAKKGWDTRRKNAAIKSKNADNLRTLQWPLLQI